MAVSVGRVQNENPFLESMKTAAQGVTTAMNLMQNNKKLALLQQEQNREQLKLGWDTFFNGLEALAQTDDRGMKGAFLTSEPFFRAMLKQTPGLDGGAVDQLINNLKNVQLPMENILKLANVHNLIDDPTKIDGMNTSLEGQIQTEQQAKALAESGAAPESPATTASKIVTEEVTEKVQVGTEPAEGYQRAQENQFRMEANKLLVEPFLGSRVGAPPTGARQLGLTQMTDKAVAEGRLPPMDTKQKEEFVQKMLKESTQQWMQGNAPRMTSADREALGLGPGEGRPIYEMRTRIIETEVPILKEQMKVDVKSAAQNVIPVRDPAAPTSSEQGLARAALTQYEKKGEINLATAKQIVRFTGEKPMSPELAARITTNFGSGNTALGKKRLMDLFTTTLMNAETAAQEADIAQTEIDTLTRQKYKITLPEAMGGDTKEVTALELQAIGSVLATYTAMELSAQNDAAGPGGVDLFTKDVEMAYTNLLQVDAQAREKLMQPVWNWRARGMYNTFYKRIMEVDKAYQRDLTLYNTYIVVRYNIEGYTAEQMTKRQLEGKMPIFLGVDPGQEIRKFFAGEGAAAMDKSDEEVKQYQVK